MKTAYGTLTASLLTLVFAFGCGGRGDEDTPSVAPAGRLSSASGITGFCVDARLATAAGRPLDQIEILGLDVMRKERSLGEFSGVYVAEGVEREIPVPVRIGDQGEVLVVVPAHSAGRDGGQGRVRLTDDQGLECPMMDLTVEPTPAAPGETIRLVESLQLVLIRRIELLGYDVESALAQPVRQLPVHVAPHVAALQALQGTDDEPPVLDQLTDRQAELELADAIFARANANSGLGDEAKRLQELTPPTWQTAHIDANLNAGVGEIGWFPFGALALMQGTPPQQDSTIEFLNSEPVTITNAEQLSHYMRLQAAGSSREGAGQQVIRDLATAANLVITVANPVIGTVLCTVRWAEATSSGAIANALPCCFESFEYDLDKTRFEEDYEFPPYGKWSNVQVTASNAGWNLTSSAVSAAACVAALAKVPGAGIAGRAVPDLEGLAVPSTTWGPITLTPGPRWNKARAHGAIRTVSTQNYAPTEVGVGKLTVETLRGRFGHAHKALSKQVEVDQIHVAVTPGVQRVEPGDSVELRAFVRDSVNPRQLEWKVWDKDRRQLRSFTTEYVGGPEHRIQLTVPRDEDRFPIEVEAESTSRTGLRKHATERRYGSATLTTGVVVDIGPEPACVDTKPPPLQMFAEVVGAKDERIDWRVMSGPARVNSDGEVTATGEGEALVRGTSVADDRAWDEATIDVGKCTCSFSAILSGDTNKTNARGEVAHFSTEGRTTIMGAFSNPEALEDVMGVLGGMMGEEERQQMAEESEKWKKEMEAMPRETLGISLMEMNVDDADEQMLANFVGGFKLQASVLNQPIEPGFAGGLSLGHVYVLTGDWDESLSDSNRFEWVPGAPGNVDLIVNHYNGRSLSGTLTGNMFATNVSKRSGEPLQISFSVYFYALPFDPLNGQYGCIVAGG